MIPVEATYWAVARDSAAVINLDPSNAPGGRWGAPGPGRALDRLCGREPEMLLRGELQRGDRS
jgi:hypothetical protein